MRTYFTVATDKDAKAVESLKERMDVHITVIGEKEIKAQPDKRFAERAIVASMNAILTKADEAVFLNPYFAQVKPLDDFFKGDDDAVVFFNPNNKNPQAVWSIPPPKYIQPIVILVRNKQFAKEWLDMCFKPFFDKYAGRELDVLNILAYYGDYKVKAVSMV